MSPQNGLTGALTVNDLLATPHLGLDILGGANGGGSRVLWAHISDVEDPSLWLDGGELVITHGGLIPAAVDEQLTYVRRIALAGAAGLAIGTRSPHLHREIFDLADEMGFPVMRIAREVPYSAVTRWVADAGQTEAVRRLQTHIRIFDTLMPRATGRFGPLELFRRLEDITGYRLYVVTLGSPVVINGMAPLPEEVFVEIGDGTFPAIETSRVISVPVPHRPNESAFVVALERPDREPAGLSAVRHVATIAALELVEVSRGRAEQRRRGSEILSELMAGRLDVAAAERRLGKELGFDITEGIVCGMVEAGTGTTIDQLDDRLADEGVFHVMVLDGSPEKALLLFSDRGTVMSVFDGLPVHAGLSQPRNGLKDWAVARQEARWALTDALSEKPGTVAKFNEDRGVLSWLTHDFDLLRMLVRQTLGPLLDYDEQRNSNMTQTLRVFFETGRNHRETADLLFVHKHTLTYRLGRVEDLTGRDLSSVKDQAELWLAFRALELLNTGTD